MTSAPMDLEAAVRRSLGVAAVQIGDVERDALEYDAFLAGRALARLRGMARVDGTLQGWSFIEKRTEGPAVASAYLYDNGMREFAAYRSGLLGDLAPGVRAPRLLAAVEDDEGGLTLWMEDLAPVARNPRTADEILLAARHLGRLSGRWLGSVPDEPWLFTGWIERHSQPAAVTEGLAIVEAARGDAKVEARMSGRLDQAVRLIGAQPVYASIIRRLPVTLCHHDAVAANVFRRAADDGHETVLIDWESVGPGAVGADLASLLFASPRRGDFSARLLRDVFADAIAAYRRGLDDVGASVDPRQVELGVHASIALRWALARDVVRILRDGGTAVRGSALAEPPEQAMSELLALVPVLLDSAAEARRIMRDG